MFACLTYEHAGLSLKYLVPLAAIGRAYINTKMQAAVDLPLMSIYLLRKRAVIAISEPPMDGFAVGRRSDRYQTAEAGVTADTPSQLLILSEFLLSNA